MSDTTPQTCEDRGYVCCDMLTPDEHTTSYGYPQAGTVYGIYSIKHGYLANQGSEWWWQQEPTGWAIVTDDQAWLNDTRDYAQERFGTFCYIKIVPSKDGGKA